MKIVKNYSIWELNKPLNIGMVHLKPLPGSPNYSLSIEEIYEAAKYDLLQLIEGNANAAIVENMFDSPYTNKINLETFTAYTHIFTRLKEISSIPLGVNIHSCDKDQEMVIATICGADFIRAESFVESRYTSFGIMNANAHLLMRTKRYLNSNVKVFADINAKHSFPISSIPLEVAIKDAINAKADGIILTGLETGNPPTIEDAKMFKQICKNTPLIIGSGINQDNIDDFLKVVDGVIVGSSIKENGIVENPVNLKRTKALFDR